MSYTITYTNQTGKTLVYRRVTSYDVDEHDFLVFKDEVTQVIKRFPKMLCTIDEVTP
jgi:peptidyl-tRNA hydrolase